MLDTNPILSLDAVLPAQWFLPKKGPLSPEQRLALAILENAWDALNHERTRAETEQWFSADDWDSVFSFNNIVDSLNLGSPTAVRIGMFKKLKPRRIHAARGS